MLNNTDLETNKLDFNITFNGKKMGLYDVRVVDGKMYAICFTCLKPIRIDKPIFGSLHLCV